MALLQFFVRTYKDNSALYPPDGVSVAINCNHIRIADYGINTVGEIVPLPRATEIPGVTAGTDLQHGTVMVPQGSIFPPNYFADSNFKNVTHIKDMVTSRDYYVDTADYTTNVINCNPVAYVTSCDSVSNLAHGALTATTAVISWTKVLGSVGVEYINKTANVTPVIDGTFADVNTQTLTITGLTTATTYYFFIRTICQGMKSAWTSVSYTTA